MRRAAVVAMLACAVSVTPARAQANPAAQLYDAAVANLTLDPQRPPPHVSIESSGDVTITFSIRDVEDDPAAVRAGALSDTLTVLRSVFGSSELADVRAITVLGTFPFQGTKSRSVRETPVLRAVLSTSRAQTIDWSTLQPDGLPTAVDTWWVQAAFANVGSEAASQPLRLTRAHLDETIAALEAGQVRIARSQFKQFFDSWDDVSDDVAQQFPAQFDVLDTDLAQAEVALLHTQPEDLPTAQSVLVDFRAILTNLPLH